MLRYNLIGFLSRLCRESRATDCPDGTNRTPCSSCLIRSRSGDVPLKTPVPCIVYTQSPSPAPVRLLWDIASEPQREAPAFAAHPIGPVADRVILLPADAAPSALGILRPCHAMATSVQQPPPDDLQRDRRHGNAMPGLSVRFAHHANAALTAT
jgi:hypothetical protein